VDRRERSQSGLGERLHSRDGVERQRACGFARIGRWGSEFILCQALPGRPVQGVPADGFRDVPDISLPASADHDGYWIFTQGTRGVVGGTSVASPVFAGMIALLNQYQVANGFQTTAGQGNINPQLYSMAQSAPGAFHDITVGDNVVTPCSSAKKLHRRGGREQGWRGVRHGVWPWFRGRFQT